MSQVSSAKNGMEVDDVWDDTELIKMYEESIKEIYKKPKNGVTEKKFTGDDGHVYVWKVGGKCMAPFEENGKTEYFAATIDSIGGTDNLDVAVTFLYYGNQAVVHMKDLWENEEAVAEAIELEKQQKEKSSSKSESRKPAVSQPPTSNSVFSMPSSIPLPSFAPPVPPNIVGSLPASEKEALSSMLMSWYMSGYHTGYYQALTDQSRRADN